MGVLDTIALSLCDCHLVIYRQVIAFQRPVGHDQGYIGANLVTELYCR